MGMFTYMHITPVHKTHFTIIYVRLGTKRIKPSILALSSGCGQKKIHFYVLASIITILCNSDKIMNNIPLCVSKLMKDPFLFVGSAQSYSRMLIDACPWPRCRVPSVVLHFMCERGSASEHRAWKSGCSGRSVTQRFP